MEGAAAVFVVSFCLFVLFLCRFSEGFYITLLGSCGVSFKGFYFEWSWFGLFHLRPLTFGLPGPAPQRLGAGADGGGLGGSGGLCCMWLGWKGCVLLVISCESKIECCIDKKSTAFFPKSASSAKP